MFNKTIQSTSKRFFIAAIFLALSFPSSWANNSTSKLPETNTPNFNDENPKVSDRYIGKNVRIANLDILISELDVMTDKTCLLVNMFFMLIK